MKTEPWFIPDDQLEPKKDCNNCKYKDGRYHQCGIRMKAMEYISLEGEEVKFSCSLHGYKEE